LPVPSMGMLLMLTTPSPCLGMRNMDILKGSFNHGFAVTYYEILCRFDPSAAKIDSGYSMMWGSLEEPRWRSGVWGSQLMKGATKVKFHEQFLISPIRPLSPLPLLDLCSLVHNFSRNYIYPCRSLL
jgi:hypothetical protein